MQQNSQYHMHGKDCLAPYIHLLDRLSLDMRNPTLFSVKNSSRAHSIPIPYFGLGQMDVGHTPFHHRPRLRIQLIQPSVSCLLFLLFLLLLFHFSCMSCAPVMYAAWPHPLNPHGARIVVPSNLCPKLTAYLHPECYSLCDIGMVCTSVQIAVLRTL